MSDPRIEAYKTFARNETDSASTARLRAHYIDRLAADVDVWSATSADLEDWLGSRGWSPASYNAARAHVKHFYRWARRRGHRPDDPAVDLRPRRVPRKVSRIADDEGIIHAAMRAPVDTRVMLLLGAECGLRRSEIAKVHRNDIEGEWLFVLGKGGHERQVHLTPAILELLEYLPANGYIFPGKQRGHIAADSVYRRIRRLSGFNTHSLRHRAGTAVYRGTGNNLRVAQEFLGHANPAMTARYVHITHDDLTYASKVAALTAEPTPPPIDVPNIGAWRERRARA